MIEIKTEGNEKFKCKFCGKELTEEEIRTYYKVGDGGAFIDHILILCEECLDKHKKEVI